MPQQSSNNTTDAVSENYGRALFDLAKEAGTIDATGDELNQVVELCGQNADLASLFAHQTIDSVRRAASIEKLFDGQVSDSMLNFLLVVNRKGRLGNLPMISAAFDRLAKDHRGEVDVQVYSARALNAEQLASVAAHVSAKLGKKAVVQPHVDPSLIGGLRLRIGDRLVDASVAAQLRKMSRQIEVAGQTKVQAASDRILQEA